MGANGGSAFTAPLGHVQDGLENSDKDNFNERFDKLEVENAYLKAKMDDLMTKMNNLNIQKKDSLFDAAESSDSDSSNSTKKKKKGSSKKKKGAQEGPKPTASATPACAA